MDSLTAPPVRNVQTFELKVCNHSDVIQHIEYDYYSRRLALVSSDKIVSIYTKLPHNRGWSKTGQFRVNGGATLRVRWANPVYGQIIATASFDGNIYIYQEHSKFSSTYNYNEISMENKGQLIVCEWHQKSHIKSTPPTSITDIRFAPHYFGLLLGACNSKGEVIVYEAQNSLSLDTWIPVMKLQVFEFRCRAITFSTDRFNTVLMAACTDDDRSRADRQVAIFPYARTCDIGVETPDITYISPTAGLSVPLPPTDVEFSPTGAYAFQRLAIAVGQCIVIYHVNAIPVDQSNESSDSPVSSLSESSANTVVRAPTISIIPPKSEEEEIGEEDDDSLFKFDKTNQKPIESKDVKSEKNEVKESVKEKIPKKSVQFNIDNNASRSGAKSPIPRKPIDISDPGKIKPSLKQSKPAQEPDEEKTPTAEISYDYSEFGNLEVRKPDEYIEGGDASVSDEMSSVPSPIPIRQRGDDGELLELDDEREEEKAEDADSENSETPALEAKSEGSSITSNSINIPKKRKDTIPENEETRFYKTNRDMDQRTFYDDIEEDEISASTIRQTVPPMIKKLSIFGKDDEPASPHISRQDSKNYQQRRKGEKLSPDIERSQKTKEIDIIKPPEQSAELVKRNEQKQKAKNKKRRHHVGDTNDENHHKDDEDQASSFSSDSGIPIRPTKKQNEVEKVGKKVMQESTTNVKRTAKIIDPVTIEIRPKNVDGKPIEPKAEPDEEESHKVKLITMRQAVLRAGRAQAKRLTFNHTGSLITAIYADGRVRVWKRINPALWHCSSVIEPPIVKGKEDLEVLPEGVYY